MERGGSGSDAACAIRGRPGKNNSESEIWEGPRERRWECGATSPTRGALKTIPACNFLENPAKRGQRESDVARLIRMGHGGARKLRSLVSARNLNNLLLSCIHSPAKWGVLETDRFELKLQHAENRCSTALRSMDKNPVSHDHPFEAVDGRIAAIFKGFHSTKRKAFTDTAQASSAGHGESDAKQQRLAWTGERGIIDDTERFLREFIVYGPSHLSDFMHELAQEAGNAVDKWWGMNYMCRVQYVGSRSHEDTKMSMEPSGCPHDVLVFNCCLNWQPCAA
eukprot:9989867-Karenia_brevis.AAC.1